MQFKKILVSLILVTSAHTTFATVTRSLGCNYGTNQIVTINNLLANTTNKNVDYIQTETSINVVFYTSSGSYCYGPIPINYMNGYQACAGGSQNGCSNIGQIKVYPATQVMGITNWGTDNNNNPYTNYAYAGSADQPYVVPVDSSKPTATINIQQSAAPVFDSQTGMVSTPGTITATSGLDRN